MYISPLQDIINKKYVMFDLYIKKIISILFTFESHKRYCIMYNILSFKPKMTTNIF